MTYCHAAEEQCRTSPARSQGKGDRYRKAVSSREGSQCRHVRDNWGEKCRRRPQPAWVGQQQRTVDPGCFAWTTGKHSSRSGDPTSFRSLTAKI